VGTENVELGCGSDNSTVITSMHNTRHGDETIIGRRVGGVTYNTALFTLVTLFALITLFTHPATAFPRFVTAFNCSMSFKVGGTSAGDLNCAVIAWGGLALPHTSVIRRSGEGTVTLE
jgi:hypothetical protein